MNPRPACFLAHFPPIKFVAHLQVQLSPEILEPILNFNKRNFNKSFTVPSDSTSGPF